jgi:L-ectoine synthase
MKVIDFDDIRGTPRAVHCPQGGFISYRYLLESDGLGYTVTRTFIPKGLPQTWHYTKHLESCYCVSGEALLGNLETGEKFTIKPGTLYALDRHDKHLFCALEDTTLICVFNPPLKGREVHGADHSYGEATA